MLRIGPSNPNTINNIRRTRPASSSSDGDSTNPHAQTVTLISVNESPADAKPIDVLERRVPEKSTINESTMLRTKRRRKIIPMSRDVRVMINERLFLPGLSSSISFHTALFAYKLLGMFEFWQL